ncbi:MAG: DoxX family protein [Verrucomicrobiaceae bacterium]|nr:MAG: DoxX family protein [Verrucomicrobiaceae bacterium]
MKHLPAIAGVLLGLPFVAFGLMYFTMKMPSPPMNELQTHFMAAMAPSGWLGMVKALEVVGGLLVAIPRTRAAGLLVLGPILINIIAYSVFLAKGEGLFSPPIVPVLSALALYLVWVHRAGFCALLDCCCKKAD